ncbi:hypothetical protein JTE90_005546 [Oedothorax gibbosus]|uniref:Lipase domain-containing protein n=1 Tax=Oedothorax gibbosus TaxID=931172 RepID=A0AAV6VC15_9ARAC|nr:hypothetical protein JTE90_005546 [Oedothorax gibbosus]
MSSFLYKILILIAVHYSDARSLGNGPAPLQALNYIYGSAINIPINLWNRPKNEKGHLEYHVFTKKNPEEPCLLEPTMESLHKCDIEPENHLVMLICGFLEEYQPGNLFEVMKNKILENGPFTVIIFDWSKYNGPPVSLALYNMQVIGPIAADMLNFITENAGVPAENMILAGHSLGGHLAGYIGKRVPNLGRIDSLDPSWQFMESFPYLEKISYKDAKFVRVFHSSYELTSFGITSPLGHIDIYFNGGISQPRCEFGATYQRTSGDWVTIYSVILKYICPHEMMNTYYIYTMNTTDCQFLATHCDSYEDFQAGKCPRNSSVVADIGFYGDTVTGLPKLSKFYIEVGKDPPYCQKNGDQPSNTN